MLFPQGFFRYNNSFKVQNLSWKKKNPYYTQCVKTPQLFCLYVLEKTNKQFITEIFKLRPVILAGQANVTTVSVQNSSWYVELM